MKRVTKVTNSSKDQKDSLVNLLTLVLLLKSLSTQTLIVSSDGIFINKDSIRVQVLVINLCNLFFVLKDLKNKEEITEVDYSHLYQCSSCLGILYGMAKAHKPVINQCPSLQPILFAINTPSYKLAKLLVPLLTPLTSNNFTIKDSFSFVEEVPSFDCAYYMASFNIEPSITNIPLEETINICVDKLFENNTRVNKLTKESF